MNQGAAGHRGTGPTCWGHGPAGEGLLRRVEQGEGHGGGGGLEGQAKNSDSSGRKWGAPGDLCT